MIRKHPTRATCHDFNGLTPRTVFLNKVDLLERKILAGKDPRAYVPGHYKNSDADSYLTCEQTCAMLSSANSLEIQG